VSEKERMLVTRPTALTVLCAAVYGCAAFGPCDVSQINQRESDGIGTCGLAASAPKAPTAIANDPASHRLEKAQKSRNPFSSLFSLQASSSSTLRFYATNRYAVPSGALSDLTIAINMHMRNSEYSSSYLLPPPPRGVNGLPVRVRRDPTSAISIRKAGQVSSYISPPCGERKGSSACSYGRAVAKIVCAKA
jgi:hypothetical protein